MHADKPVFIGLAEILRMHAGAGANPARLRDAVAPAFPGEHSVEDIAAAGGDQPGSLPATGGHAPTASALPADTPAAPESAAAIRSARLFRAALGDALDALVTDLVRTVAVDIVAREVEIAPVDVARIVQRTIAERWFDEPLRVRVAPGDAQIGCELPVVADPRLEPGDAVLECRYGSVDARLHVRLAAVLGELRP